MEKNQKNKCLKNNIKKLKKQSKSFIKNQELMNKKCRSGLNNMKMMIKFKKFCKRFKK